mmetsp:Transcript_18642/g.16624  ORF Transcript_18642/g.16624 Transcript_18642/m.16624 type:complete len:115 (+) Transcript_18642:65-409(+)
MDEREIAKQYLLDHKINKLFKRIMVLLLLHKPGNVKRFIVDQLRDEKNLESKPLLSNDEMETMFKMLENPAENGFITGKALNDSLIAMGIIQNLNTEQKYNLQQFKCALNNILN